MIRREGTLSWPIRVALVALAGAGLYVSLLWDAFTALFFLSYVLVGGLLAIKRPKNLISWLLIAIAFSFIGTTSQVAPDIPRLKAGTASLSDEIWVWFNTWSGYATFVLFAALAATFPSGRLPVGRWRLPLVIGLLIGSVTTVLTMIGPQLSASTNGADEILVPSPFALIPASPAMSAFWTVSFPLTLGVAAMAVGNLLVRYRSSSDTTRLQIRWLLVAVLFVLIGVVTGLILGALFQQLGGNIWIPAIVAYPTVPIAIGVAILRYRLYEIDRIVNRAILYSSVTAILAGLFAAVTLLTQRVFVALTGQKSDAAIVLTTLGVATLYSPVRKQVERLVDRYFKYDQRLFGAYREELRRTLDVLAPAGAARRLAREALAETGAIATAVVGSDGAIIASAGEWPAETSTRIALSTDGAPLQALLLGARRDGRPHRAETIAALGEVGGMAATASTALPSGVHEALSQV